MDELKYEIQTTKRDVGAAAKDWLLAIHGIGFACLFFVEIIICLTVALILQALGILDSPNARVNMVFASVCLVLVVPAAAIWLKVEWTARKYSSVCKSTVSMDRQGFTVTKEGSEPRGIAWQDVRSIQESKKFIFVVPKQREEYGGLAIPKNLLPPETIASIRDLLLHVPVPKKTLFVGKSEPSQWDRLVS